MKKILLLLATILIGQAGNGQIESPVIRRTTTPVNPTIRVRPLKIINPVEYNIGAGQAKVTDPATGLGMQGMSDDRQKTDGVHQELYARAFIIQHIASGKRVILLNADIWSCTHALKSEVVRQLGPLFGNLYTMENVMISGTHNHSGPGGYSHYYLYNHSIGGFDRHNFQCIVSGMVQAIKKAHANMGAGRIYMNKGDIPDCGRNRSVVAYNNNTQEERNRYAGNTDKEMLLLKFVKVENNAERPVGAYSWYGIHPTDRGQTNTKVTGDNKGFAAYLFESQMRATYSGPEPFVAVFANGVAGDVSGNVEYGSIPDGVNDIVHMQINGRRQFDKAKELFNAASLELKGPVAFRHRFTDMVARTGAPGALGLSMFAGSTEDSDPRSGLKEGIVEGSVLATERLVQGGIGALFGIASGMPYATAVNLTSAEVRTHLPKPITLVPGFTRNGLIPLVPTVLPVQLFTIGPVAIVGVPAEFTTMAGWRLKTAMLYELAATGVSEIAVNCYANDYSQYVTTEQEYQKQHYEGASTLFGPNTLNVYLSEYRTLAGAIRSGTAVSQGGPPPDLSGQCKKLPRITIRNATAQQQTLYFYNSNDGLMWTEFHKRSVAPYEDVYFNLKSFGGRTQAKVVLNGIKTNTPIISEDCMLLIGSNNMLQVTAYTPPPR